MISKRWKPSELKGMLLETVGRWEKNEESSMAWGIEKSKNSGSRKIENAKIHIAHYEKW